MLSTKKTSDNQNVRLIKKGNYFVIKGNNAEDVEAKKASVYQIAVLTHVVLIETQPQHSMWHQRGSKKDTQDIWCTHEGQIVAPTSLLNILIVSTILMVLTIAQGGK